MTTTTATIFLNGTKWFVSEPTSIGFRHTPLGTLNTLPSKADAEARFQEMRT